ncbi:uncharacterized protein si:dkey-192g7.3 isoform X2 [Sebastes umbrosus]|uniref:uncharacterized protein si:dkey-192g7.3 isoform X2 n=1 Tax=Sebastes umbrosus TaxID=72105 RepID=UPI00189E6C1A|nr:uncharacterized protein si:dkey-192g7.3 isoform X2 [Sebastes umbrosus]
MRTFLGLLMVLIVSGDEVTREGVLGESVLLPCDCSERDLDKEFKWQINEELVFNGNTFEDKYKGRAKIFLSENNNNCSILLTNIMAEDQGKYTCRFDHSAGPYNKEIINLNLSARYNVCQKADNLSKVFQCDVTGRHGEAWIQWDLDGQLLTNSTTTSITHTYNLDAPTGLYHFHSTLSTKLNGTSELRCDVKAKDISTIINFACTGSHDHFKGGPDRDRHRYLIIFPIMLVIGLSLLLKYFSRSLTRKREEETDSFC